MIADMRVNIAQRSEWAEADSVYNSSAGNAFHGMWNWGSHLTTANGWTAWWRGYGRNCAGSFDSNWSSFWYGQTARMTITKQVKGPFQGRIAGKVDTKYISIAGSRDKSTKRIVTPSFNSPFVYFENAPKGPVSVSVSSSNNRFLAEPAFDSGNSWNLLNSGDGLSDLSGKPVPHLFYEFSADSATLSRNGRNFASKSELESFLRSGFLGRLGMSAEQSDRSLGYLVPKLPEARNYYLTTVSEDQISQFSKISVSPAPESLRRVMYVVYPSAVPVKTSGDLTYPIPSAPSSGFRVTEFGEAVMDSSMRVFWKE